MKKTLLLVLIILSLKIYSQDTITYYFDSNWKKTTKDKASFYRKAFKENALWAVKDYSKNGKIQMIGNYSDDSLKIKIGDFKYYFDNGIIQKSGNYNQNGKENGYWTFWYQNGVIDHEGNYSDGKMIGEWRYYYENGKISSSETYKEDNNINVIYWNENGEKELEQTQEIENKTDKLNNNQYFLQQKPQFPGGEKALLEFISKNTEYPKEAKKKSIKGKVFVGFIIDKDGSVTEIKILRSIHPLLDEAALDVVRKMPKWTPGKQHNRFVKISFQIPVNFK